MQQVARYDSQWRTIHTTKGSYAVTVNPVLTTKKAAPSLTLQVEMGSSYNRSVNASCACGTLAKLGRGLVNVFSDVTRGWYLQGYYENYYFTKNELIDDFMFTATHDSGHSILASYAYKSTGLSNYSWGCLKEVLKVLVVVILRLNEVKKGMNYIQALVQI